MMCPTESSMELNLELAYYVVHFHSHLMSDPEIKAQRHLFATMKATMGRSDEAAQREKRRKTRFILECFLVNRTC